MVKVLFPLPRSTNTIKKNKELLTKLVKEWAEKRELPFVDQVQVTGMDIVTVDVDIDMSAALAILGKNPKFNNEEDPIAAKDVQDAVVPSVEPVKVVKGKKNNGRKKEVVVEQTDSNVTIDAGEEKMNEIIPKLENLEPKIAPSKIKKAKTAKRKSEQSTAVQDESLQEAKPSPAKMAKVVDSARKTTRKESTIVTKQAKIVALENIEASENDPESQNQKSVTWGKNDVKPFYKQVTICSFDEAKKSPVAVKTAPKVLKKTDYVPKLLPYTAGSKVPKKRAKKQRK